MVEVQKTFRKQFGYTPTCLVRAPGRLELLGNHTDYNQGLVMSLAIDRYITMAASPRQDGIIELVSSNLEGHERFRISNIEKNQSNPWADYIKGVVLELQKKEVPIRGFSAAVHGSIPLGAGLSSSGALVVATALLIRSLWPYSLTETGLAKPPVVNAKGKLPLLSKVEKLNMARLCHAAESNFVGVNCGLLDQLSSLFGKSFHSLSIDCRDQTVEYAPFFGSIAVVVCHSGVTHALVEGGYNQLRLLCEAAAKKLGVISLRLVEMKELQARKALLMEREFECAYHIVGEVHRVVCGERALRDGDFVQFGQYMLQSHESSRDYFRNSCQELDILVDLARNHTGCLGSRLTGGGFGGATINLVRLEQLKDFSSHMEIAYEKATGIPMKPMVCQVVDGADVV